MKQLINIPNLLTCFRLCCPIPMIYLLQMGNARLSFILFICAAISDFLDGVIARKFNMQSTIGAILDPLADKVLMISMYAYFMLRGDISWATSTIVIMRDVLIIVGVVFLKYQNIHIQFSPLYASKINTAIQLLFLVAVYACMLLPYLDCVVQILSICVVLSTIYSGYLYYRTFIKYLTNSI